MKTARSFAPRRMDQYCKKKTTRTWSNLSGVLYSKKCQFICSFLRDVLVTVAKCSNKSRNPEPPICLCYSILLQQRNHELSLVQRINTALLSEGNAKKMVRLTDLKIYTLAALLKSEKKILFYKYDILLIFRS